MSTASIIAVADADFATTGKWKGVRHHHDGFETAKLLYRAFNGTEVVGKRLISDPKVEEWPEWRGKYLLSDMFAGKLNEMLSYILSHKAGWSTLHALPCHCDLPARPAGKSSYEVKYGEACQCSTENRCHCHGWNGEDDTRDFTITNRNVGKMDAEYVVVVDLTTGMGYVGPVENGAVQFGQPFNFYDPVEPDWEVATYGEMRMRVFRDCQAKNGQAYSHYYANCPNGHQFRRGYYTVGDKCEGDPGQFIGFTKTGKPKHRGGKRCNHIFTLAEGVLPSTTHIGLLPDELRLALPS